MSPPTYRILIIDDNPDESSVYGWYLGKIKDFKAELEYADGGASGLKKLAAHDYDLAILDFQMPHMNGLEVLAKLRESGSGVPVVMMTGGGGERVAVESLKLGAIDYVLKEDLPRVDFGGLIRRAIEVARLKADKKELERLTGLKNEFLDLLTMELQTPLVTVFGVIDTLVQGRMGPVHAEQKEMLATIAKETQRLYDLIEDLVNLRELALGGGELARARLLLRDVVKEQVEGHRRFFEGKGLTLESSLPEEALELEGDHRRLRCVVDNLLSNALRCTPFGGTVGVLVRRAGDGAAELSVADTGSGLSADSRAHLFDLFFKSERRLARRYEGLGIGLAISRQIVEAHGGTLAVASAGPDKGTVVTARLPLQVKAPAAVHSESRI